MSPYSWLILVPSLYRYALCSDLCGETIQVSGEESGDVLLQVKLVTGITDISWIRQNSVIAVTRPHEAVEPKESHFKNRLNNGTNGSLQIKKLKKADQGLIVANIHKKDLAQNCDQDYNLTVYSKLSNHDIKIHHNITWGGTCNVTLTCIVDKKDVSVAWNNSVIGTVWKVPTVQVTDPYINSSWTCTASHPVTSVSKTVLPLDLCQNEDTWKLIICLIPGILLSLMIVAAIIFCFRKKIKNIWIKWYRKDRLTSASNDPQQPDSIYWEIDQSKEVCGKAGTASRAGNQIDTVYMTAMHLPLKPTSRRGELLQDDIEMYCD
ncbi:SLAM family member 6-like isoform X2 [Pyxicephalus adspersus]|uniref:SLAM family member 6-like isoform X2 n=1 Tax=Pyxicephalus adspersus TaxID=30357 RepID=UPI003B58CC0F